MKNETKPTQEEKAAYMATNIGCKFYALGCNTVLDHVRLDSEYPFGWIDTSGQRIYSNEGHALLTSLADITDEDAIEVAQLMGLTEGDFELERKLSDIHIDAGGQEFTLFFEDSSIYFNDFNTDSANSGTDYLSAYDFLRSRGYAIPFRNYSVQDLQDFGWLKLRQKGGEQNG